MDNDTSIMDDMDSLVEALGKFAEYVPASVNEQRRAEMKRLREQFKRSDVRTKVHEERAANYQAERSES